MVPTWCGEVASVQRIYKISTKELADRVGIVRPYLSEILCGRRKPRGAEFRVKAALAEIVAERESKQED